MQKLTLLVLMGLYKFLSASIIFNVHQDHLYKDIVVYFLFAGIIKLSLFVNVFTVISYYSICKGQLSCGCKSS